MLDADLEHMQPSGEPYYPSTARYCHLAGTETDPSKGHPLFCQASSLRIVGNMVGPMNSLSTGSLPHFFLL